MKKCLLTMGLVFTIPFLLFSQKNERIAKGLKSLDQVPQITMPELDNELLLANELERRGPGIAPQFAKNMEVDISPDSHGLWETTPNGNEVWRLRIYSKGAKSLNLGFSKYLMPKGGSLILYTPKRSEVLGPFTPSDNEEHEELWTPIVAGDELILEVQVPALEKNNLQLQLKSVNHDYLGFAKAGAELVSGSCNLDVICSEADGWGIVDGYRDIIRSVAVIGTNGNTFCTGFLINNVNNDCTPFFMTANHCQITPGNAASFVAYWNYESPTCRQPGSGASGGNGNGSLADFNTGAIHRASYGPSDFTLIELDDPVSETANAFFAGWSAEYLMPQDTVICIHHPSTDEKRISFEFNPTQPGNGLNGNVVDISNADHVIIPDWDIGTTEGGSSGSPLFNNQKQVVGQLHGGAAACGNNAYDSYGWFYTSWEGGGTVSTSLKPWLDPNDTGLTNIGGKDCSFSIAPDPIAQELCAPDDAVLTIFVAENFAADVTLSIPNLPVGAIATFSTNPVPPNGSTTLTISNTSVLASGQYLIDILANDGINDATSTIVITLFEAAPMAINLSVPPDGEVAVVTAPTFDWAASSTGTSYTIEIAEDDAFTNIVDMSSGLTSNSYNGNFLNVLTTYYWRVRGSNLCGDGPWSSTWSFTTADINCGSIASTDVPIDISPNGTLTVTSEALIATTGLITDLNISNLDITHTYVGDLAVSLQSPSGTIIQLFDRPGVPNSNFGCPEGDLLVSFNDSAANTADDFENTCEDDPAIGGEYQPIDPLADLIGEDPNGIWTLILSDNAGGDGGTINAWSIDLCTSVPVDLSLSPSENEISTCLGAGNIDFTLTVGNDFEATGVMLSANGNPAGSSVTFSSNPAMPGEVVNVSIVNANTSGTYVITFSADDGINNTDVMIDLVLTDLPGASNLLYPANAEINIPLLPTLEWEATTDVSSYYVEVATDAAFTNVIDFTTTTSLTYTLSTNLEFGTSYFWRVNAVGDCGETMSSINTYITIPDIAVGISPAQQTICNSDEATFEIMVGPGFVAPANISYTIMPNAGVTVNYDVDPNNVMPGTIITATMSDLINAIPNTNYTVTFDIADATNNTEVLTDLVVIGPPAPSSLTAPNDGAIQQPLLPVFSWTTVADASDYLIEIATDELFTNIIEMQTTTATNYNVTSSLDFGTLYYWQVTASNGCGGTGTVPYSFTTEFEVAVDELEGNVFQIMPNPTSGHVDIVFAQALNKDLTVEVYSIDGKLLQQHRYANTIERLPIELDYASGVYIIKLVTAKAAVARRVVVR